MNPYQHQRSLEEALKNLKLDTQPQWGKMTAQHMIEHLAGSVNISNGRKKLEPGYAEEELNKAKGFMMSERAFPRNIGSTPESALPELRHKSIEEAVRDLQEALREYEDHHVQNSEVKYAHPRFGYLNKNEWDIFHHKHFTHHFRQFGLIE